MAINPACNALTTVTRLRASGFGGQATDDALQIAINAVSTAVERGCERVFREITYGDAGDAPAEVLQGSGRQLLVLSTYPVLEVISVRVGGNLITDWRLIPDQAAWGAIYRRTGWPRSEGLWGTLVSDPNGQPDWNIEVSYRAGFRETPADLELAVMQEVDLVAAGGKASRRVKSERTPGGWSIAYGGEEHECSVASAIVFAGYKRRDL